MTFIQRLGMSGLLSFSDDMEPLELQPLNVLIGPNGSGKSNVIETLELLRAIPTDFAAAIRDGGGAAEWLWKGMDSQRRAAIHIQTAGRSMGLATLTGRPLRCRVEFASVNSRIGVLDEAIEEIEPEYGDTDTYFYTLCAGLAREFSKEVSELAA